MPTTVSRSSFTFPRPTPAFGVRIPSSAFALLSLLLLLGLSAVTEVHGAFTLSVASANDTIEQNVLGAWCFYPSLSSFSSSDENASCTSLNNPSASDLRAVLNIHLSQPPSDSLSIAYYSASLNRLGGAEFPVDAYQGKVYLCASGQTDPPSSSSSTLPTSTSGSSSTSSDGRRYKTICEVAVRDNEFGLFDALGERRENKTACQVEVGQRNVSDGCYAPVGVVAEDLDSGALGGVGFMSTVGILGVGLPLLLPLLLTFAAWTLASLL